MTDKKFIDELVENGKKNGTVSLKEILEVVLEDSEEFEEIKKTLEAEEILIEDDEFSDDDEDLDNYDDLYEEDPDDIGEIPSDDMDSDDSEDFDDFIDKIENDPEFAEFTIEIENELKTKDIEDLIPSTTIISADDPVKMYLKEIGQIPLLTAQRELELSRTIQEGLAAEEMLESIKKNNKTVSPEEMERIENLITEGEDARAILTESNLRLVVSIARKFLGRGMQIQDLIQEGSLGLMKVVKKFDPTKGCKFSTYATWWIKQAITRAISDQSRTIRIPVHMGEQINRMARIQKKLTQELHREPTVQEIADEMGEKVEKIRQIQKIAQEPVSLEKSVGEEDDSTLGDFISDTSMPNPLEYTMQEKFKEELDKLLKELHPREEQVMRLRYGLIDGRVHTLEEVGKLFNVTRERIRQIEAKAIKRLKNPSRQAKLRALKGYID